MYVLIRFLLKETFNYCWTIYIICMHLFSPPSGDSGVLPSVHYPIKILRIRTPEKFAVIILPLRNVSKRCRWNGKKCRPWSIRLLLWGQSDLDLHCLLKPICLKTSDHYGIVILSFVSLNFTYIILEGPLYVISVVSLNEVNKLTGKQFASVWSD